MRSLYELICNSKICLYDAFYSNRAVFNIVIDGIKGNKDLILVLSVICYNDNETFAIPLKIRINAMETTWHSAPDVFLFFDESNSLFLFSDHRCLHKSYF